MRQRHVLSACAFALASLTASAVVLNGPSVVTRESAVTPTGPQQAIPLPAPAWLLLAGVGGLAGFARRARSQRPTR